MSRGGGGVSSEFQPKDCSVFSSKMKKNRIGGGEFRAQRELEFKAVFSSSSAKILPASGHYILF